MQRPGPQGREDSLRTGRPAALLGPVSAPAHRPGFHPKAFSLRGPLLHARPSPSTEVLAGDFQPRSTGPALSFPYSQSDQCLSLPPPLPGSFQSHSQPHQPRHFEDLFLNSTPASGGPLCPAAQLRLLFLPLALPPLLTPSLVTPGLQPMTF